jgi:AcrR family transcriptional regulator
MDTKQQILDSAQRVISQKGFSNARVSDIVADAGVAQGTFYLYFKCKQDIILEIAKQITFAQNARIEKFEQVGNFITKEDFIAQIYDIFDSYVHFFEKHAAILRVLATETGNNPSQEPVINAIVSGFTKLSSISLK